VVLSGDDALTLPVIALGGAGVISVAANEVPFAMARMVSLCLQGDFPGACEMHRRLHPLMEVNFVESNPGPVKAALSMMGQLDPVFRLPVVGPRRESLMQIEKVLLDLGLIPPVADHLEVPFGD
jgi:4-hydroxy-tetrahydrodipicolinate synthase